MRSRLLMSLATAATISEVSPGSDGECPRRWSSHPESTPAGRRRSSCEFWCIGVLVHVVLDDAGDLVLLVGALQGCSRRSDNSRLATTTLAATRS